MVIAFAGRRIDADAEEQPRFPEKNIQLVRSRLEAFFQSHRITGFVSSAACGADLIALQIAISLSLPIEVILPSDTRTFKKHSVTDRPGDWGPLYDSITGHAYPFVKLRELRLAEQGGASYHIASRTILEEAQRMAEEHYPVSGVACLIVWEGRAREQEEDYTAWFAQEARRRNIPVKEILTV